MFAIIDIETTGGSPGRDRITEICVVLHDGLAVTEVFSTLINPERRIPENISRLTGITNEMVENAPKFYEVAKRIIELTEGRIFVAHNVSFDYGFIKEEYRSLGYKYRRDQLCTVRLARKLIPGKRSYSLGRICEELGIDIEARHRAKGDAEATARLFDILLQKKSENPTYRRQNLEDLNTTRIDKLKMEVLKRLPEETGVYYFLGSEGNILYIGKSNNMRQRAIQHFASAESKSKKLLNELYDVDFVKTGSELIALLKESEEIKKHKPPFNRARKQTVFSHAIDWSKSQEGFITFDIVPVEQARQPLAQYTGYMAAREQLNVWVEDNRLCLNYAGLNPDGGECFHHQIRKCVGVCVGEESAEEYNRRAERVLEEFLFSERDFLLIDKGRNESEQSLLLIENGTFAGWGYMDLNEPIYSPDEMRSYIGRNTFYPDANHLVRGWLKRNPRVRKVVLKR